MRENIYYWKCDNPIPIKEKLVYNKKYAIAPIDDLVKEIFYHYFGKYPQEIKPTDNMGNHYVYFVKLDNREYVFRSDDGKLKDDYLVAEKAAMQLAKDAGVPVPEVYVTDISRVKFPINYQIMEKVPGENMAKFLQDGTLNKQKASKHLGNILAKMHTVKLKGFGFFNTDKLQKTGQVIGLDSSNKDYFYKRLDDHIEFLLKSKFLTRQEANKILWLIKAFETHLEIKQGVLVHKDITFWNLIGTKNKVRAIVDWDDVISGDPIDDIAVMRCFYKDDIFQPFLDGYKELANLPEDFEVRLNLYVVRNMLWKAVFRIYMGYMSMESENKRLNQDKSKNLWQFTKDQLFFGVRNLEELA